MIGDSISVKLISNTDIIECNCLNINNVMNVIEDVLLQNKKGRIILPDKISQTFDEKIQNRINCMPATLIDKKVSGVKWVSVFPSNPQKYNCPNVSGVIILSELEKGYPFAIMDGRCITTIRTACMGAVGAKYLARKDSSVYCSIGAGEQAKMHFLAIKNVCPEINTCYVASRTPESEVQFVDEMRKHYEDVKFICCNSDYTSASRYADIIVTAVSCQLPLLKADSVKEGAFYCHVGGWEDEYEVPLKASKIVCDNWNALKHRSTPTISKMYQEKKLLDSDIYADIVDIIDGIKPGRENDKEFIYFNSIGLGFIDVAVALSFYQNVIEKGKGIDWTLDDLM